MVDELIPRVRPADELAGLVRTETVPAKAAVAGGSPTSTALAGRVATVDLLPGAAARRAGSPSPTTSRRRAPSRCPRAAGGQRPARAAAGRRWPPRRRRHRRRRRLADLRGRDVGDARGPARRPGHPGAGRPAPVESTDGGPETASSGTPAPSGSLMITLAVSAAQAEAVVFGIEHGTLWLSLEPEGADDRRHRRRHPGQRSTGRPSHEPRRSRRSRRGPDPARQAGADGDVHVLPPGRLPADPAPVRAARSTASCPTSC